MNAPKLTQFLVDVTRGRLGAEFREDRHAVIDAVQLSPEIRQSLRDEDLAALWRHGAHPMALLYFARACGWDSDRYYLCIQGED